MYSLATARESELSVFTTSSTFSGPPPARADVAEQRVTVTNRGSISTAPDRSFVRWAGYCLTE